MSDLNPGLRLDAEFFSKPVLSALKDIRKGPHNRLGNMCAKIQHPVEVKRNYEDVGLLTIMAKNVRSNRVDISDQHFMPANLEATVARNELKLGDVLVTRTGANYGQVAPWKIDSKSFACADLLIVRQPSLPAGYLSSFLESAKGKPIILRGGYGGAQPHIAPPYLGDVPIPRFENIESRIDQLVNHSVEREAAATKTLKEAEDTLLTALGLVDWTPPEPLNYTANVSSAFAAGRLDAQYFRPLFSELEQHLTDTGRAIELGTILTNNARGRQPKYAEHGLPVINSKHVRTNRVSLKNTRLASEAGSPVFIEKGDVLLNGTGVGTIGRAAPFLFDQRALPDNHVTVLRSENVDPIYLAVFLNSPLGQWQIERHIKGSSGQIELYPTDIAKIVFWDAPDEVQLTIRNTVLSAFDAERRSIALLEAAKRAVEVAIEESEKAALAYLDQFEEET